jgi:NADH-quinone oxidoreductase subunit M
MIFLGAFKNGWEIDRFHIFQIATVLALWGVVISTVYMLRAYRKTFMGALSDRRKDIVDLPFSLRIPVAVLVSALLCYGFFPQSFVRIITPAVRTYLSANK